MPSLPTYELRAEHTLQSAHPMADMVTRNIIKFVITRGERPGLNDAANGRWVGVRLP
jgi:hypothetical protein